MIITDRTRRPAKFVLALAIGLLPFSALPHHSTAEYDNDVVVEYEGLVTEVLWRNPHVRISIDTLDDTGVTATWELEGMGVMRLDRAGIERDLVHVGDRVRFAGNPSTRRDRHMYVTNVLLENGSEILLRTTAVPRWTDRYVSIDQGTIDPQLAAADRPEGIFRVWVPTGRSTPNWTRDPPLTAAAEEARARYDAVTDDPVLDCTPPGMPRVISRSGGHPIRFSRLGDDIVLHNEYFALDRIVHMGDFDASTLSPTALGYSVGRWENDSLVITTTRIDWPYFQLYGLEGVPQSPAMVIEERFTPSEDQTLLVYDIAASDPATFTRTVRAEEYVTFTWMPGLRFLPYECVSSR